MNYILPAKKLDQLLEALKNRGYELVGPTVRDSAIVYDSIESAKSLPQGVTEEQEAGTYRLKERGDQAYFGYTVGPHSWKKYLHPPTRKLWSADKKGESFKVHSDSSPPPSYAFIGVRACEIKAIEIQDRVFLGGPHQDPSYQDRRNKSFIVAINCSQAAPTCFCVSMETGPKAENGFDLALTEVLEKENSQDLHYFLVQAGSTEGEQIVSKLSLKKATTKEEKTAQKILKNTASQMGRKLDTHQIKELFYQNYEHPRWNEVAERCLACANCTMVCPTCFCSTVEDVTDLTGEHSERWQKWDSCFTADFTHLNGVGSVRPTIRSRYRQWLSHKLATWIDQFGSSGCVGCGRCITWCPVGIDLTEETAALRKEES